MIWKAISVFLLSTVKFAFAFPVAYGAGIPFLWMFLATSVGGMTGVAVFAGLSGAITSVWLERRHKNGKECGKKRKVFSRSRRFLVKIKVRYGLPGIALLTPVILSIPVGTFVAIRYYRHQRKRVVLFLSASVLLWSLLFSGFGELVGLLVP